MTTLDTPPTTKVDEPTVPTLEQYHYYMFNQDFNSTSVGSAMSFILCRNLMKDKDKPSQIKMIINSPGGSLTDCFALIDTMKGSKIPIWTFGLGLIASCGLVTFIAGQKGHRYITRNTSILSHQYSWGSYGKEHELFSRVEEFNHTTERMVQHYKKCSGLSEKKIREILLPPQDVWLDAKDAVKYKLADKIVDTY